MTGSIWKWHVLTNFVSREVTFIDTIIASFSNGAFLFKTVIISARKEYTILGPFLHSFYKVELSCVRSGFKCDLEKVNVNPAITRPRFTQRL